MEVYYRVQISYPNGRVEEIDEKFTTQNQAIKYGETMLAQIPSNKNYRDDFEQEASFKSYFFVIEYNGEEQKVVFESKHRQW